MNRIRTVEINSKLLYQVIITPYHTFDTNNELMMGNWTDDYLNNFSVETFVNMEDAMKLAYTLPDISWSKLILFHQHIYYKLYKIIDEHININNFTVEFKPHMMLPNELKNYMFDKILIKGDTFRLKYNLSNLISFVILNSWTKIINDIALILKSDKLLRITSSVHEYPFIKLIGTTDINTTFQIILTTPVFYNALKNNTNSNVLKNAVNIQKNIDKGMVIR